MGRKPKKYALNLKAGSVVELAHFETGEIYEPIQKLGPQIHCPNPDYDLLVDGVQVEPCDNSETIESYAKRIAFEQAYKDR